LWTELQKIIGATFCHTYMQLPARQPCLWNRYCFSARCFVRTNRRAIATMFVCLSVRLSVRLERACIVITWCILARI